MILYVLGIECIAEKRTKLNKKEIWSN